MAAVGWFVVCFINPEIVLSNKTFGKIMGVLISVAVPEAGGTLLGSGLRPEHLERLVARARLRLARLVVDDGWTRGEAAKILADAEKTDVGFMRAILRNPEIQYTLTPHRLMQFAAFLKKIGTTKRVPASWREFTFDEIHRLRGD